MTINHEQVEQWIQYACDMNNMPELADEITYDFRNGMTKTAGLAYRQAKYITFSTILWNRATQEERKQLVVHETCHIVACEKYNVEPSHGKEWQQCMANANVIAEQYHTINRDGLRRVNIKYECQCGCTRVFVGDKKAAQVRQGNLECQRCGTTITLTGNTIQP